MAMSKDFIFCEIMTLFDYLGENYPETKVIIKKNSIEIECMADDIIACGDRDGNLLIEDYRKD